MRKNSLHGLLSRAVDIRPSETAPAVLMFLYFFLITSSAYIIIPVKISLYLQTFSAKRLPYAYLLTALVIGFAVTLNNKLLKTLRRNIYISLSLIFFITNLLVFWLLFQQGWRWVAMVFWFWEDIFIATSVTQYWILVNDIYTPRQARRLVGFFVSGGLLGGIAGAQLASRLAQLLGTANLLLICPLLLALGLILVNAVHKRAHKEAYEEKVSRDEAQKEKTRYSKSIRLILKNRHLLLLCGIVAVSIIVTTLIDFQFNTVVENAKPERDIRTAFLGTFFTLLLVFSYVLHIFLTNRVLKNYGIRVALAMAPSLLLACSAAIFLVPLPFLLQWAVIIKGTDKSLAHSLNQSVKELLYIPVPADVKYKAKVFIDMFINKFAKGVGAILILFFFTILHFSIAQMSLLVLIFALLWIIFGLLITKEYVSIVKKNLKIKWQDADKFLTDAVDIDMTKLVFDTLQSRKKSSVLYAMNLFDLIKKEKLSPELKKIITQKSDHVQACAMDSLFELDGEALLPDVDDTLEDDDLDTQIDEIISLDVYQEVMKDQIHRITQRPADADEVKRMEAAKLLGMMDPNSPLVPSLSKLLRDDSPEVVKYALESARNHKRREFIPHIIKHLENPINHREASRTLVDYGVSILGTLKDYLSDPDEDIRIRQKIPDILNRIGTQRAADLLTLELKNQRRDLEPEIIEAMHKIRSKSPDVLFQKNVILPEAVFLIKKCFLILMELDEVMSDAKRAKLSTDLERNLAQTLKHIFELLSLIYPHEDIIRAYQNIAEGTRKATDYSLELLDNVLKKEIKEILFPLIDDISFEEKVRRCRHLYKTLDKD